MDVIIECLLLAEQYLHNLSTYKSLVEFLLTKAENYTYDLHEERQLPYSEEIIEKLNGMCRDVYRKCVVLKQHFPEHEYDFDHVLMHLINTRKYFMFFNLEVPLLQ